MGPRIEIHKPGDRIYVMTPSGKLTAYVVLPNGEIRDMDVHEALEREMEPDA